MPVLLLCIVQLKVQSIRSRKNWGCSYHCGYFITIHHIWFNTRCVVGTKFHETFFKNVS
jgi:hypothetical protein